MMKYIFATIFIILSFIFYMKRRYDKEKNNKIEHDKKLLIDFFNIVSRDEYEQAFRELGTVQLKISQEYDFMFKADEVINFCDKSHAFFLTEALQQSFDKFTNYFIELMINFSGISVPNDEQTIQKFVKSENFEQNEKELKKHYELLTQCKNAYKDFIKISEKYR